MTTTNDVVRTTQTPRSHSHRRRHCVILTEYHTRRARPQDGSGVTVAWRCFFSLTAHGVDRDPRLPYSRTPCLHGRYTRMTCRLRFTKCKTAKTDLQGKEPRRMQSQLIPEKRNFHRIKMRSLAVKYSFYFLQYRDYTKSYSSLKIKKKWILKLKRTFL